MKKMKKNKIVLIVLILCLTFVKGLKANSQILNIQSVHNQNDLAETVYNRLEFKENLPEFTERYIDRIANQRTEIPVNIWNEIKNNMDYSVVKEKVINALNSHFSNAELQSLINKYLEDPMIPITKISFRNELFSIIEEFSGGSLKNQIDEKLISSGYNKI